MITTQPNESLSSTTKASITIKNYLGGMYYFTSDEISIDGENLFLIEGKHSVRENLPSISDIKDGLLKMVLYSNLKVVKIKDKTYKSRPVLELTSPKLIGSISSDSEEAELEDFLKKNEFKPKKQTFVKMLMRESKVNNFNVIISGVSKID